MGLRYNRIRSSTSNETEFDTKQWDLNVNIAQLDWSHFFSVYQISIVAGP